VLALALVCCLAVGVVTTPAAAGDGVTVTYFEPDELEVDAGETVTLDLVVSDHGDYSGNGIDELSATIGYDPDTFAVADVEHGPMLADDDPDVEVDGEVDVDDEAGTVTVEQERTPSGDGTTGTDTAITLTLEVDDDADPATETIEIADASTVLVTDYPQNTIDRDATIHVEGGAEQDDEQDDDGADDDPDGVTLADEPESDDANASDEADAEDENGADASDDADGNESTETNADSIPGFAAAAAVAILGLAALLGYRRRS
jgi:hypothetical protein